MYKFDKRCNLGGYCDGGWSMEMYGRGGASGPDSAAWRNGQINGDHTGHQPKEIHPNCEKLRRWISFLSSIEFRFKMIRYCKLVKWWLFMLNKTV